MTACKLIQTETENGILTVTLNRPHVKNAMSLKLLNELIEALTKAEKDNKTRAMILRGSGGNFSAGADIKDMAAARAKGDKAIWDISVAFGNMISRFANTPLTVVSALEGVVMGGGFGLACASDIAIASHTVRFSLPETRLGLVPAQIAPVLLERIGYSHAKRLAVTGASMNAQEALQIGLIHAVSMDLDDTLKQVVSQILQCAPGAVAQSKKLLRHARFHNSQDLIDVAADLFVEAVTGAEGGEGTKAFIEKRPPKWAQGD